MDYNDVRSKYLEFFKARGHAAVPSASLAPENDPTTLFTGSGMQPLLPYLLGEEHPKGTRIVDSQKCFRAEDIEEVGDNRHTTFFEMLGNWSLGDYFKGEQLPWVFAFLTKELGLDPSKLYVTVFDGAPEIDMPRDEESIAIWQRLLSDAGVSSDFQAIGSEERGYEVGMESGARIFSYDAKKNWWSRAGVPKNMPDGEPGGPDSEIFYDFGTEHDPSWGAHCHPNCDCGRFMEIGNSVFMEYVKKNGKFEKLEQKNVDFGGGLERITAAVNGNADVFQSGTLKMIIDETEKHAQQQYSDANYTPGFRVIADHIRGAAMMIADGITPSNSDRGYFVRRLIRRSVRYADYIGLPAGALADLAHIVAREYGGAYPEVKESEAHVREHIAGEEEKFRKTLEKGLKQFEKLATGDTISGEDAFVLFSTYGFPVELTEELAAERGASVDMDSYRTAMEAHQAKSRVGAEKKFKGGLADQSEEVTRLHSAHHLLLKALQEVLGEHVKQRGSNITGERLRIDFSHEEKLTESQKQNVERIVNEKIQAGLPVIRSTMAREEAERLGAEMEFGQKYPDTVTVYSVGPADATAGNPQFQKAFSLEFCGGPHVANTSEIGESGVFKITSEKSAAAGIRRIKAVLE